MEEVQTWRELLGQVTGDPQERQRIAQALSVSPITLMRWTTGKTKPRQDNLRPLLDAVPQYRQKFIELIPREFPHFHVYGVSGEEKYGSIPSTFYAKIFNKHTNVVLQQRTKTICTLIFQQILEHLDPQKQGLSVILLACVVPRAGYKVKSLRKTVSQGTALDHVHQENWTKLCGAESQAGHAVIKGRPVIIQTCEEKLRLFPLHHEETEESTSTYPILLADRVAGCVCIVSSQPNYFTTARQELLQNYIDLVALAFEADEFYDLNTIELGIMPPPGLQWPLLTSVSCRVTQRLNNMLYRHLPATRLLAEQQVWQEVEEEFLNLSLHNLLQYPVSGSMKEP